MSASDLLDRTDLEPHLELFCCPKCGGGLELSRPEGERVQHGRQLHCRRCQEIFGESGGIPRLFWPNDWEGSAADVTEVVQAFYEETPFPDYDDFDSVASLQRKARAGRFARLLDEQVPAGARVLECGCGTGQLSNFLSIGGRTVFATDMCMNSLRLGQDFARRHHLERVHFVQMNLFRPAFRAQSFHLVISNGVLHHTSDPFLAFRTIAELVKPGGYLLVGLYHRYGRLITDARRTLFRMSGNSFKFLDPNLRNRDASDAKKRAWFADQYQHPHESKHTLGEALRWLDATGLRFVSCLPSSKVLQTFADTDNLFEARPPGGALERFLVETGMIFRGSREGGFFIVIGKKP